MLCPVCRARVAIASAEGQAAARARGVHLGRVAALGPAERAEAARLRGEGLTQREIADALHCKLNNVAYIFRTPQLKAAKPSPAAAIRRRLNRVT